MESSQIMFNGEALKDMFILVKREKKINKIHHKSKMGGGGERRVLQWHEQTFC